MTTPPLTALNDNEKETLRAAATTAYEQGDYATAREINARLAEAGDALGQYNLGVLHSEGRGVPQNYTQARDWYERAAEQGDAKAQTNLGVFYADGRSGTQDYALARLW